MLCFHIFSLHRYLSGAGNHQKKSHKKWQKNLHLNIFNYSNSIVPGGLLVRS